jgi:hypothetical protein
MACRQLPVYQKELIVAKGGSLWQNHQKHQESALFEYICKKQSVLRNGQQPSS